MSFERYLNSRISDEDLLHNGFHPITPDHLLDTLESAKEELSFSNYDTSNINRVIELLIRYYKQNNVDIK